MKHCFYLLTLIFCLGFVSQAWGASTRRYVVQQADRAKPRLPAAQAPASSAPSVLRPGLSPAQRQRLGTSARQLSTDQVVQLKGFAKRVRANALEKRSSLGDIQRHTAGLGADETRRVVARAQALPRHEVRNVARDLARGQHEAAHVDAILKGAQQRQRHQLQQISNRRRLPVSEAPDVPAIHGRRAADDLTSDVAKGSADEASAAHVAAASTDAAASSADDIAQRNLLRRQVRRWNPELDDDQVNEFVRQHVSKGLDNEVLAKKARRLGNETEYDFKRLERMGLSKDEIRRYKGQLTDDWIDQTDTALMEQIHKARLRNEGNRLKRSAGLDDSLHRQFKRELEEQGLNPAKMTHAELSKRASNFKKAWFQKELKVPGPYLDEFYKSVEGSRKLVGKKTHYEAYAKFAENKREQAKAWLQQHLRKKDFDKMEPEEIENFAYYVVRRGETNLDSAYRTWQRTDAPKIRKEIKKARAEGRAVDSSFSGIPPKSSYPAVIRVASCIGVAFDVAIQLMTLGTIDLKLGRYCG